MLYRTLLLLLGLLILPVSLSPTVGQPLNVPRVSAPISIRITGLHENGSLHTRTFSERDLRQLSPTLLDRNTSQVTTQQFQAVLPNPEKFKAIAVEQQSTTSTPAPPVSSTSPAAPAAQETRLYVPSTETGRWRPALQEELQKNPDLGLPNSSPSSSPETKAVRQLKVKNTNGTVHIAIYAGRIAKQRPERVVEVPRVLNSSQLNEFLALVTASSVIMHHGDNLPDEWLAKLLQSNTHYVRVTPGSPNLMQGHTMVAARLGERSLNPAKTRILSALPDATRVISFFELSRMGLASDEAAKWRNVNTDIQNKIANSASPVEKATKSNVLDELAKGDSDVVVLIAHSDGKDIYLPGLFGGKLSFAEIESIRREEAPNRVIVLLVCHAGTVSGTVTSFSEVIIKNKLAKTVLASPKLVGAEAVPQLLADLTSKTQPMWEPLQGKSIFQIVLLKSRLLING